MQLTTDLYKLISSSIGQGAFCVLIGEINSNNGKVKVEIHKVFRILLNFLLFFPLIGLIVIMISGAVEFSITLLLVAIGQILLIRYVFVGFAFNFLSRKSLNRLRDVLNIEWVMKV